METDKVQELWDIIEINDTGQSKPMGYRFTSIETAMEKVRKLNKKALSQSTFHIKDITHEA